MQYRRRVISRRSTRDYFEQNARRTDLQQKVMTEQVATWRHTRVPLGTCGKQKLECTSAGRDLLPDDAGLPAPKAGVPNW